MIKTGNNYARNFGDPREELRELLLWNSCVMFSLLLECFRFWIKLQAVDFALYEFFDEIVDIACFLHCVRHQIKWTVRGLFNLSKFIYSFIYFFQFEVITVPECLKNVSTYLNAVIMKNIGILLHPPTKRFLIEFISFSWYQIFVVA